MNPATSERVLPYRGAAENAGDGRLWFSPRAAVAGAVVLLTVAGLLLLFVPAGDRLSRDFGAAPSTGAGWILRLAELSRGGRMWAAGATGVLVFAVLAGLARRRAETTEHRRSARWRLAFATTAACLGLTLATAFVILRPVVQLHRDLTRPISAPGNVLTFTTSTALYRHIAAQELGSEPTPDEVVRVTAGAFVEYHPWLDGQLWVIAPSNYFDPGLPPGFGYFRGAQGNGSYYVVVRRADGMLDLVAQAGGNHYELNGEGHGATFSTSWHMSAAEKVHSLYRFDGRRFVLQSERTETVGDE